MSQKIPNYISTVIHIIIEVVKEFKGIVNVLDEVNSEDENRIDPVILASGLCHRHSHHSQESPATLT